ncbi:hypothetical protein O9G_003498 [Rozella allomycis CSF55]|uniref:Uncharacterized protein n=1 Tax=Rozella allomycis (strain CSF55) TaxID=988480 RepID=A0A075B2G7_ROZAC|nr:hypothetical protein O9G_003498 [Rozella allomycis CSF55]|eukprot:EPZ35126.1 hypothetical protein O9G_003498 [Rozella allomycis CSF55]
MAASTHPSYATMIYSAFEYKRSLYNLPASWSRGLLNATKKLASRGFLKKVRKLHYEINHDADWDHVVSPVSTFIDDDHAVRIHKLKKIKVERPIDLCRNVDSGVGTEGDVYDESWQKQSQKLDDLIKEIQEYETVLGEANQKLRWSLDELDAERKEKDRITTEKNCLNSRIEELIKSLTLTKDENAKLKSELENVNQRKLCEHNKLMEMEKKISDLDEMNKALISTIHENQLGELKAKLAHCERELLKNDMKCEELNQKLLKEKEELLDLVLKVESEKEIYAKKSSDFEKSLIELKNENDRLKNAVHEQEDEISDLNSLLSGKEKQLSKNENEISELQMLLESNEDLNAQNLKSLKNELGKMSEAHNTLLESSQSTVMMFVLDIQINDMKLLLSQKDEEINNLVLQMQQQKNQIENYANNVLTQSINNLKEDYGLKMQQKEDELSKRHLDELNDTKNKYEAMLQDLQMKREFEIKAMILDFEKNVETIKDTLLKECDQKIKNEVSRKNLEKEQEIIKANEESEKRINQVRLELERKVEEILNAKSHQELILSEELHSSERENESLKSFINSTVEGLKSIISTAEKNL